MHLYLGAVGLESIDTNNKLNSLLKSIIKEETERDNIRYAAAPTKKESVYLAQIKHYFSESSGISINGFYSPKRKSFKMDYYFPFLDSRSEFCESDIIVSRKTEREAYNVLADEPGRGIALIFHMSNPIGFLEKNKGCSEFHNKRIKLSGMSNEGKILLPVNKTERQLKKYQKSKSERNKLIDLAEQGDKMAMDDLAVRDIFMYSDIYKRIQKEDMFSVVDSTFMPSGFECDIYSVVGNIIDYSIIENCLTKEECYVLMLECNGIRLDVCINKSALYGVPEIGRRFKGRIWLQGEVEL